MQSAKGFSRQLNQARLLREYAVIDIEGARGRPAVAVGIKGRLNLNTPLFGSVRRGEKNRAKGIISIVDHAVVNPVPPAHLDVITTWARTDLLGGGGTTPVGIKGEFLPVSQFVDHGGAIAILVVLITNDGIRHTTSRRIFHAHHLLPAVVSHPGCKGRATNSGPPIDHHLHQISPLGMIAGTVINIELVV